MFPLLGESHVKKLLTERCGCQLKAGTTADDPNAQYEFAPGAAAIATPVRVRLAVKIFHGQLRVFFVVGE